MRPRHPGQTRVGHGSSTAALPAQDLSQYETRGDYEALIDTLRQHIAGDRRVLADPWVKDWCGRRWRHLFVSEAVQDPQALQECTRKGLTSRKDSRPLLQRIAERFLRGVDSREVLSDLPEARGGKIRNATLLFAPGLLNGMLPTRGFQEAFPALERKYGWRILRADSHPMRGCDANGADLLAALEEGRGLAADTRRIPAPQATPPSQVVVIGYSKGAPDILTLLAQRPDLKDTIRCVFNWAGAVRGSYLANDLFRSVKDLTIRTDKGVIARVLSMVSPLTRRVKHYARLGEYDIKGALRDLTTNVRERFLEDQGEALDALDIPFFNITGSTTITQVPVFQIPGVLALNRYDTNNDMQLTQAQAKVALPMGTDLAMLNAHHWDVAYSGFPRAMRFGSPNLDHPFPKEAAAAAMFKLAAELGLID